MLHAQLTRYFQALVSGRDLASSRFVEDQLKRFGPAGEPGLAAKLFDWAAVIRKIHITSISELQPKELDVSTTVSCCIMRETESFKH